MKAIYKIIFAILLSINFLPAQQVGQHSQFPLNCKECHFCKNPTYNKPCLKLFPKFVRAGATGHHTLNEAPKLIIIDTLSNKYGPVVFDHRIHAQMAQMNGGCKTCHHHNPPGKILACSACHKPGEKNRDITKPTLKGAYHQLCIGCHRKWNTEWKTKSECYTCHRKATPGLSKNKKSLAEIAKEQHTKFKTPNLPKLFVLKSDNDEGPLVTFHHKEHIATFGLSCEACHKNNTCADCHKLPNAKKQKVAISHDNCVPCHKQAIEENCNKCHGKTQKPLFDHAKTGWVLKPYHKALSCKACHKNQVEFKALNTNCNQCHKTDKWQPGTFNHAVTGLVLDKTHRQFYCEVCHVDRKFDKRPQCTECHDDKAFPKDMPGKLIRK